MAEDPSSMKAEEIPAEATTGTTDNAAALLFQQTNNDEGAEEVDEVMEDTMITSATATASSEQYAILLALDHLPTSILTPSPFPQHNDSSRFRTAYQRITANPYDTEAWQAVMTEAVQCANTTTTISPAQLAWVASCYGTVLQSFPYAVTHITGIVEILLQQRQPPPTTMMITPQQQQQQQWIHEYCERQLRHLFAVYLGVAAANEGPTASATTTPAETNNNNLVLCTWVVDLWLLYIRKVREDGGDVVKAFQRAVAAGAGDAYNNHVLWKAYVAEVTSTATTTMNDNLATRRSVFQQLVIRPMTGLDQYWHAYEQLEAQHPPIGVQLIAEFQPKYQSARTAYLEHAKVMQGHDLQYGRMDAGSHGGSNSNSTHTTAEGGTTTTTTPSTQLEDDEDDAVMTAWLWKTAYERTRAKGVANIAVCRQWYCQMVCTLSRHPEAWYMWATFDTANAVAIWEKAMECIPDSTLLAYCRASAKNSTTGTTTTTSSSSPVDILAAHVAKAPTSLGFLLLQQAVRRNQSMTAARRVFAQARRVLEPAAILQKDKAEDANATPIEDAEQENKTSDAATQKKDTDAAAASNLDDSQGGVRVKHRVAEAEAATEPQEQEEPSSATNSSSATTTIPPGPMTWHVYAAHATMEQYQNQRPDVAAKVYALGLRTHHSWITIPAYVRRYASLLTDPTAVRALWQQAVAAASGPTRAALYNGWLETEALLGGSGGADAMTLAGSLQAERYAALHGEKPDVVTGKWLTEPSGPTIMGAQKISVAEYLIRERGLEESTNIACGLNRVVDTLSSMGAWGDGRSIGSVPEVPLDDPLYYPGGDSDIAMQKRLRRRNRPDTSMLMAGGGLASLASSSSAKQTARDRLGAGGGPQGGTAILMMIQQSPDWLRPLLLLLPASKMRQAIVAKPPPHMTEMALSTLQKSSLPAERPLERKRNRGGGDSSDDDDANTGGASGYSIAFRKRQQARMTASGMVGMLQ